MTNLFKVPSMTLNTFSNRPTCTMACRARRRNRNCGNISASSPQQWPKTMSCENSRRKTLALRTTKNMEESDSAQWRSIKTKSTRETQPSLQRFSQGQYQHQMQLIVLVTIHVSRIWSPFYLFVVFSNKKCVLTFHQRFIGQETLTL